MQISLNGPKDYLDDCPLEVGVDVDFRNLGSFDVSEEEVSGLGAE